MKNKITISFVIPAYNEEGFIDKCLSSVEEEIKRSQVGSEIIVVDNSSTDKTREIVSKFKKVKIISETKRGLTFARQAGFLSSRGELIANIDADTILPKGWIECVLDEFSKNKNLIALSGPQIYYDVSRKILIYQKIFYKIAYLTYLFNKYILNKSSMLQGGNFVVRRDALEKIGGFNTNILFWGEDTDIAKRLHKFGDVKFTFKLPIYSSGRRLIKEGVFKTAWRYTLNYFYIIFFDKPFHKDIFISQKSSNSIGLIFNKIQYELDENKLKIVLGSGFIILAIFYYLFYHIDVQQKFYNQAKILKAEIINILKR